MGCGGSREVIEGTERTGAPRPIPTHPPRKESIPPPREAPVRVTPTPAGPPPTMRARRPDDRVNSENRPADLHYVTPRGNLPLKMVNGIVQAAPAPPVNRALPARRFPKEYRNDEGPRGNTRQNFAPWEIQRQGGDGGDDGRLYEYPVKTSHQRAPFSQNYNFRRPPARLQQLEDPPPNDVANYRERWRRPPNDPGPIRAVANTDGVVVGAMYHPEGNARGYERALLQPLDSQGRGERDRRCDMLQRAGRTSWPQRGPV